MQTGVASFIALRINVIYIRCSILEGRKIPVRGAWGQSISGVVNWYKMH